MNNIDINLTPDELTFTSLCVKILGMILKDKPDAFREAGISGIMLQVLAKEVDMCALFEKFEIAMLKDMLDRTTRNRKY